MIQTNWYVITGTTSSGKTTLLNHLAFLNYNIIPEAARIYIDNELSLGKTIEEIRENELGFQEKVLKMKINLEDTFDVDQITFFERGIPDTDAYLRSLNQDTRFMKNISNKRYKGVFLMDPLPFKQDYARTESPEVVQQLDSLLFDAYKNEGYDVIRVPVMSVVERAQFVLDRI